MYSLSSNSYSCIYNMVKWIRKENLSHHTDLHICDVDLNF